MKISREIKTALLVISSILLFIWGYSFLKGRDLFTSDKNVFVVYDNVLGLAPSAPVTLNGFKIGKINNIKINPDGKLLVELQIQNQFPISKSSIAEIYDSGLVGGKEIAIIPNLDDKSVIEDGDYLKPSKKLGLTDNLALKLEPFEKKIQLVLDNANNMMLSINQILDVSTQANLKKSFLELSNTLTEFSQISKSTNQILNENKLGLKSVVSNFDKTSANLVSISDSLAKVNISKAFQNLENTLVSLDNIMAEIKDGNGSMGKLIKDDKMYNNFTNASKELELLLEDLRLHPTRYVNVSLFGKKEKPYVAPEEEKITKE